MTRKYFLREESEMDKMCIRDREYGHSGKEKGSHLIKPGYIIEKEPQKGDYNKRKPQKVRDDKIFDKRNIAVSYTHLLQTSAGPCMIT